MFIYFPLFSLFIFSISNCLLLESDKSIEFHDSKNVESCAVDLPSLQCHTGSVQNWYWIILKYKCWAISSILWAIAKPPVHDEVVAPLLFLLLGLVKCLAALRRVASWSLKTFFAFWYMWTLREHRTKCSTRIQDYETRTLRQVAQSQPNVGGAPGGLLRHWGNSHAQTGVHFAEMKTSQTSVLLQTGGQGLAPAVGIE